jgi:nicotinamide-nucleotide amidase
VLPVLRKRARGRAGFDCRVYRVVGLPESVVEEKVAPGLAEWPAIELGYSAKPGEVEVRIITPPGGLVDQAEERIRAALGDHLYGMGDDRLEELVVQRLTAAGRTIAVAESCTGGLLCHRLTNVSGASAVFRNGCVTYSNESKIRLLGVRAATIEQHGAVSEAVAREMAGGVRERSATDFGVSTTGIAGPTGGTPEKPVGLVYIGLATAHECEVTRQLLAFDRETFKFFASQTALDMVRRALLSRPVA